MKGQMEAPMRNAAILAGLALVGCTGNGPEFQGTNMTTHFEFANNIGTVWEYVNDDNTLSYKLVAEIEDMFIGDTDTTFTMVYRKDCISVDSEDCVQDEVVRSLTFTSDVLGVRIHDVDGETLDPALVITTQFAKIDDVNTTDVRGNTYTSTFTDVVDACPVRIPEWTGCAQFDVTSSGADDNLTGTYWSVTSYGLVAFDWPDQPGLWGLNAVILPE